MAEIQYIKLIYTKNGTLKFTRLQQTRQHDVLLITQKPHRIVTNRGCSSMVERELPKLLVWVRFPSPAYQLTGSSAMAPRKIRLAAAVIFTAMQVMTAHAAANDAGTTIAWDYKGGNGPAHWAQLDQQFELCATGKEQAPINIKKLPATPSGSFTLHYQPVAMTIANDVKTELDLGAQHLSIFDGHAVQVNVPPNKQNVETLVLDGKNYQLVQFHFHTPSETHIRNAGQPMEIHFVHQGANGAVAILAVLVKAGEANPEIQKIIDNMSKQQTINLMSLISVKNGAYKFTGSLTSPPCSEGVRWLVMADPITASTAQIVQLRRMMNGTNARPIQPFNKRDIIFVTESEK